MNTPTIAAVIPGTVAHSPHNAGVSDARADAGSASFSHVLRHQHAAHEQKVRPTTDTPSTARAEQRATIADNPHSPEVDEISAEQAAAQGLTLPQIALSLAGHLSEGTTSFGNATVPSGDPRNIAVEAGSHGTQARPITGPVSAQADAASVLLRDSSRADAGQATATTGFLSTASSRDGTQPANPTLLANSSLTSVDAAASSRRTMQSRSAHTAEPRVGDTQAGEIKTAAEPGIAASALSPGQTIMAASGASAPALETTDLNALAQPQSAMRGSVLSSSSMAVSTALQSPQWPADFSRQVVMLVQNHPGGQSQTAELRLDPPELGPLRITININDNVAHAVFASSHASVRHALENALPQLQQQLAQAGISLGQANVSDQGHNPQHDPSGRAPQSTGTHASGASGGSGMAGLDALSTDPRSGMRNPNALVDTFA